MSDYRCPNCSEYLTHTDNCPTGGIAAKARNQLYYDVRKGIEEYFQRQRISGIHPTSRGAIKVIDEIWQKSSRFTSKSSN